MYDNTTNIIKGKSRRATMQWRDNGTRTWNNGIGWRLEENFTGPCEEVEMCVVSSLDDLLMELAKSSRV